MRNLVVFFILSLFLKYRLSIGELLKKLELAYANFDN